MKNKIKLTALFMASVMAMVMTSACSGQKDSGNTLVMGTNAAFEPFEFITTEDKGVVGEFDGIDVVIANEIAKELGKELVIEDMEFDGLLASVQTGKIDMAVAGMTIKPERLQSVNFSVPYYKATQVMIVAPDNTDILRADDIKEGKKVGVVLGYTGDSIVTDDLKVSEENITRANRGVDIVQDVKNGKLDVVVIDSYTGKALAEKNGLKVVEDVGAFEAEEYAIAIAKENTQLLEDVNKILTDMIESGRIEEIAQQYN